MSTKHKMVVTLPHGDPDIGAEIECEIAFTFYPGSPARYITGDPPEPPSVEFVSAKPVRPFHTFPDLEQQWLDDLAQDWLESDVGQAEAFATVRADDEAAREYAAEMRADR